MKKQNGITLIALIITVIVLLILAGITINLTIGEDGIIKRAEQAGKNYQQAANDEKTELAEFTNLTDRLIDNVTKNHYTIVEGVPVPKGFTHIAGTKDTGFVIKNDTDGNEFVWVPCTIDGANGSIKYDRCAFSRDGWAATQTLNTETEEITRADYPDGVFTEVMPSEEQTSVGIYGGFYIGRYESAVIGYNESVATTPDGNKEWTGYTNGKLVVRSGQQVWNFITRDKAKKESENLYNKMQGDSVNSRLCSSYAWDTTLSFIEKNYNTYAIISEGGNYYDQTFTYIDLNGETQIKAENTSTLIPTGQTKAVNNIYDMGGNVYEWTTESYSVKENTCTARGGYYSGLLKEYPAAFRIQRSANNAAMHVAFRITLYL